MDISGSGSHGAYSSVSSWILASSLDEQASHETSDSDTDSLDQTVFQSFVRNTQRLEPGRHVIHSSQFHNLHPPQVIGVGAKHEMQHPHLISIRREMPLATGGYCWVYRAIQTCSEQNRCHNKPCVFKVARPNNAKFEQATDTNQVIQNAVESIEAETRLLDTLHTDGQLPGIIAPHRLMVRGSKTVGVLMKYYDGTLSNLNSKLTVHGRIQAFRDNLTGLQHLHAKRITHGDIKPANILVKIREPNHPKGRLRVDLADVAGATDWSELRTHLTDFVNHPIGVATRKWIAASDRREANKLAAQIKQLIGDTPLEQLNADTWDQIEPLLDAMEELARKRDLFALAASYFHIMTDEMPYPKSELFRGTQNTNEPFDSDGALHNSRHPAFEQLLMQLLRPQASDRPSIEQVLQELETIPLEGLIEEPTECPIQ